MRVAGGAIARKWLQERYGVTIRGWMSALGPIEIPFVAEADIDGNAFFVPNAGIVPQLESYMDDLRRGRDSVGAASPSSPAACRRAGANRSTTASTPKSPTP